METPSQVEVTFQPTYAERVRAEWSIMTSLPWLVLVSSIFPLAGLFLLYLAVAHPDSTPGWSYGAAFLALVFWPLMFFYNSYNGHKLTLSHGPYVYNFDPAGIQVSTPLAQAKHQWPAILRVREHSGNLLFYYTQRCAFFVPLRAFSDPASTQYIEAFARSGGAKRVGT